MRKLLEKKNKKGQIQGMIIAVITIFIIALILFFMNHLNKKFYDEFDEYFEGDAELNNTVAHTTLEDLQGVEGSRIWDYAFLAIYVGLLIQMLIFSFASRTNVAFFWIYALLGIITLIVGTMLSNIWQEIAVNPEFAETITRFTITNTLLGTYYPTIITGILFLTMIITFGKFPGAEQ